MKKILFFIFITMALLNANSFDSGMKFFIKGKYHKALPYFVKASNAGNKQAHSQPTAAKVATEISRQQGVLGLCINKARYRSVYSHSN